MSRSGVENDGEKIQRQHMDGVEGVAGVLELFGVRSLLAVVEEDGD